MGFIYSNLNLIVFIALVISLFYGLKRGFSAQLVGFLTTIIALIISALFAKPLFNLINKTTSIEQLLSTKINGLVENTFPSLVEVNVVDLFDKISALPLPSAIKATIESYAVDASGEQINLCQYISRAVSGYIILSLCYALVFVLVKIAFLIIRKTVKSLNDITLVRLTDGLLGGLLSIIKMLLIIYLVIFIIDILPFSFLSQAKNAVNNSFLLALLKKYNLFTLIITILKI